MAASQPVFEYIPVIGSTALQVVSLSGISTKHGSRSTDRGRLYGQISKPGDYLLELFADVSRLSLYRVAYGQTAALGEYFDLQEDNNSNVTGRAVISVESLGNFVIIPSFAVDVDVMVAERSCSNMPSYDARYGLAYFHAMAMREILTSALPAMLPHLYSKVGLAAFVPTAEGISLPDLRNLANADQLRVAQGDLVKALSAREAEHTEEFAAMMKSALERYEATMQAVMKANIKEVEAADEEEGFQSGVSVSTWIRR